MSTLNLRVRYFQDSTPPGVPCREENFQRREMLMPLRTEQTALILVDMWNIHFIESWLERAKQVTVDAVLPVIGAAREAGLTIVHAPSPPVADQYPQLARHAPPPTHPEPAWPPVDFRRRQGEHAVFRGPRDQPPGIGFRWNPIAPQLSMSPAVEVLEDDWVIATGEQLHDLLHGRRVLHLIYAGFATNWCIVGRDYGIRAMGSRGYNIILLRDATMGVEYPDTLPNCFATEMAIREVETQRGFSASNSDFMAACTSLER